MNPDEIYTPSKSLRKRVLRRLVPYRQQRLLNFKIDRPIVSFSFDDCPKSAVKNGLHKLDKEGWKSTVYIASKLLGITNHLGLHMDELDVTDAHNSGHEIGGHSYSHMDLTEMPLDCAIEDVLKNRDIIRSLKIPRCRTFAYPYGQTSAEVKKHLSKEYDGLRGIISGPMIGRVDLNQIQSTPLFTGKCFEEVLHQINGLSGQNAWLTLFTHDVRESPSEWGCTPAEIDTVIAAVKASGAEVLTVSDAITKLKANSL